jgi:hypothetical protein
MSICAVRCFRRDCPTVVEYVELDVRGKMTDGKSRYLLYRLPDSHHTPWLWFTPGLNAFGCQLRPRGIRFRVFSEGVLCHDLSRAVSRWATCRVHGWRDASAPFSLLSPNRPFTLPFRGRQAGDGETRRWGDAERVGGARRSSCRALRPMC